MTATYDCIATTTLTSPNASVFFSNIPSTYTDLKVVLIGTSTDTHAPLIRFNGDSGFNYSNTLIHGSGSSVFASRATNEQQFNIMQIGFGTTIPTILTMDIFSYSSSVFKTVLFNEFADRNGSGAMATAVGLWRNTSAIISISMPTNNNSYAPGTTATLYGIKAE